MMDLLQPAEVLESARLIQQKLKHNEILIEDTSN